MGKMKTGIQVYSVRDAASADFAGTMAKLKAMGYDGVELAGMYGIPAAKVREILDENGLECISAHVPYDELMGNLDGTVAAYKTVGCRFIALPYMTEQNRPTASGFDKVLENIRKIGEKCKEYGIQLLYHNHDFEFEKMPDGAFALDYLYSALPADILMTELDTCWVLVAGQSPVAYINKYKGRCPLVHLKDFVGSKSENMYALIGIDKKADVNDEFRFRPVGHGLQNMPAIIKASEECGAEWIIVEQDNSYETPSVEAAKMSIDYIKSVY